MSKNASSVLSTGHTAPGPPSQYTIWVYGLLLVTGINLCSLLGIIINPLSKRRWYRGGLLFMVSVAVGVLAGSSFLFLLSGALGLKTDEWDFQRTYIIKVTILLLSVFLFFNFEQLLKLLLSTLIARRKAKCKDNSFQPHIQENENEREGFKLAKSNPVQCHSSADKKLVEGEIENMESAELEDDNAFDIDSMPVSSIIHHHPHTHVGQATSVSADINSDDECLKDSIIVEERHQDPVARGNGSSKVPVTIEESIPNNNGNNITNDVVNKSKLSSFAHVQPVAWMVIFGDGIHNFVDGLSIGAGMAQSFPAGLSIALAVLAEELPHELGDLAVLLRAGLSLRHALLLNFLSACLCYAGFAIGAVVGEDPETNKIIYALAAGLFLYISLTDLLPEITPEAHAHSHSHDAQGNDGKRCESSASNPTSKKSSVKRMLSHLGIANSGMLVGYALMVILAIYAEEIKITMESPITYVSNLNSSNATNV